VCAAYAASPAQAQVTQTPPGSTSAPGVPAFFGNSPFVPG